MKKSKTLILIQCALFSALIAIGAFIKIPVPFMDYFTLQFLFVILSGMILGPKYGSVAVSNYVFIGLIGVPVFAGGGGIQYIFRPSFGYLLGFIVASYLVGIVLKKIKAITFNEYLIAAFSGFLVTYAIGLSYKYMILNVVMETPTPWSLIVLSCFPLDIPGDILLCVVAALLGKKLNPILRREV